MTLRDFEEYLAGLGDEPSRVGSDGGGESGDNQGHSSTRYDADRSVVALVDTGQDVEAEDVA